MTPTTTKPSSGAALEAPQASHELMHREHQRWNSENCMWRDDLAAWQGELKAARVSLERVGKLLAEHEKALQSHGGAIRCYEQDLALHEKAIAECEGRHSGERLKPLIHSHELVAEKHAQQRVAHERIKKYQHTLVATVRSLERTASTM